MNIDRIAGPRSSKAYKAPCKAATTGNITLYGEQTIDGTSCVTGDRVLVRAQTAGYENGIYVVDTGQWSRAPDFNKNEDVGSGSLILVLNGDLYERVLFYISTDDPITVGSTSIVFALLSLSVVYEDGAITNSALGSHIVTPSKIDLGAWTIVASAGTVNLGAQTSRNIVISGTTTITSFGATDPADGIAYNVRFSNVLTLTHSSTLILPGAANITTALGDTMNVVYEGGGVWRVTVYVPAATALQLAQSAWNSGVSTTPSPISPAALATAIPYFATKLSAATASATTSGTSKDISIPAGVKRITLMLDAVSTSGNSPIEIRLGTSGGVVSTGYACVGIRAAGSSITIFTSTTGASLQSGGDASGSSRNATIDISNFSGDTWLISAQMADTALSRYVSSHAKVALAATLTTIRITTAGGTDTFDAGTVNVFWE